VTARLSRPAGLSGRGVPRAGGLSDGALKWLLITPAFAVIAATLLWPLVQGIWFSLHVWNLSRSPVPGPFVGLENYAEVITEDSDFWNTLGVTALFVAFSVAGTILAGLAMALLLAGNGRLEVGVRTLLVIPFAMSPSLVGISWRFLLNPEFGAVDAVVKAAIPPLKDVALLADPTFAMVALIASDVWHWAPYFMLMFVGALATIPPDTVDAAKVDGATGWRTLIHVTLPQLRPVLAIALLLKVIFSLKLLDQVVTLTSGGPGTSTQTLSHLIYLTAFRWFDLGYAAAMAVLLALVMGVLAGIYARLVMGRGS
jgi:multiple sugar transport system permease protein